MLPIHLALVADGASIPLPELMEVAAALQKQVSRDFGPIWGIQADVSAFAELNKIPLDYWPIIIKDDIGDPDAAGYHQDNHGQPFSLVQYSDDWPLTASHEALEMLGDPFGRRMIAGNSVVAGQGRVQYLVEVCDPSEAEEFGYQINGVTMSDFYTPHFFDPASSGGARYSFTNAIKKPRQVLKGGYLSWYVPATRQWWQRTWFSGAAATDRNLGVLNIRNGNPRAAIDRLTARDRLGFMRGTAATTSRLRAAAGPSATSLANRAEDLRGCVDAVTGASQNHDEAPEG
jgi:hypothetical protein